MDQTIKVGDRVINPNMPAWGSGRVIEVKADKVVAVFDDQPNAPRTLLTRFLVKSEDGNRKAAEPLFRKTFQRTFTSSTRRAFMEGSLVDALVKEYPQLYDEDDIKLAKGPQGREGTHFCEWYAAKIVHELTGFYVLVEKAEVPSHEHKAAVLKKLMPQGHIDFIYQLNKPYFGSSQCPDLLVYAPDFSDWYFCEVKGPGDSVREIQENISRSSKIGFKSRSISSSSMKSSDNPGVH